MDKHALRARMAELERVGNRTAEQEGELKQLRRRLAHLGEDGQQRIVCDAKPRGALLLVVVVAVEHHQLGISPRQMA